VHINRDDPGIQPDVRLSRPSTFFGPWKRLRILFYALQLCTYSFDVVLGWFHKVRVSPPLFIANFDIIERQASSCQYSIPIQVVEAVLFAILLAIAAPDAQAWQVRVNDHGYELKWETSSIEYAINYAGNHGLSEVAIDSMVAGAARSWGTSIKNGMQFSHTGKTSVSGVSYDDGVNAIFFDEDWTEDPALLGLTYVWSTAQGDIVGFDMAINSDDHAWSTDGRADSNDLLNTLSHEFGHALGVDHSPTVEAATMYPASTLGEVLKRDLDEDDVDAILYLYAESENAAEETTVGCSTAPGKGLGLYWMTLLPLIALRRRVEKS